MNQHPEPVTIQVDAAHLEETITPIWRSIGYDEINWTYTPKGRQVFTEIAQLRDGPFYIRNHNAFTSGHRRR